MNISSEPKCVKVSIRFSEQELQYLENKAIAANCSWNNKPCISKFIRLCVLKEGKIVVFKEFKPILTQIRRIGTNLNQIAKLANMQKIEAVYLKECQEELAQIINELNKISQNLPNILD